MRTTNNAVSFSTDGATTAPGALLNHSGNSGLINSSLISMLMSTKPEQQRHEEKSQELAGSSVPAERELPAPPSPKAQQQLSEVSATSSSSDFCAKICQQRTHPQHHQYFAPGDDIPALTSVVSKHAYMTLADIASYFDNKQQASILTDNNSQEIINSCLSKDRILVVYFATGFPRELTINETYPFYLI
jgi:hypothetical protein